MLTRRSFIKFLGVVGFYALTPLRRFFPQSPIEASYPQTGELFADFLLLPEGAILPSFVQYPKLPMPRLCGVATEDVIGPPDAIVHFFENHEEAAQKMSFPVYLLSPLPEGLRPGKAFSISLDTGDLHSLSLSYESFNIDTQWWENVASFWIFAQYPRPFPLWTAERRKDDGSPIGFEKIDFLPTPGIKVQSQEGFVFYWVEDNILYIFTSEPCTSEEMARNLVNLFVSL